MTNIHPEAEQDVVGRHGRIGVEVIPHDSRAIVDYDVRAAVDDLFDRFDARPEIKRTPLEAPALAAVRRAEVALADTVSAPSVDTHHNHAA